VRKISSPVSIAGVSYLYNDRGQWARNMGEGSAAPGLASKSASSLPENPGEGVGEVPNNLFDRC